eukprot:gene12424-8890_t
MEKLSLSILVDSCGVEANQTVPLMESLPSDLLVTLLTDWLTLRDVAHLDTALVPVPHHRQTLLRLVSQPWMLFEHVPTNFQSPAFFNYVQRRQMQIAQLVFRGTPGLVLSRSNSSSSVTSSASSTPLGGAVLHLGAAVSPPQLRSRSASLGSLPLAVQTSSKDSHGLAASPMSPLHRSTGPASSPSPAGPLSKIAPQRATSGGTQTTSASLAMTLTRQSSAPTPASPQPATLQQLFAPSFERERAAPAVEAAGLQAISRRARSLSLDAGSGLLPAQVLPLLTPPSSQHTSPRSSRSASLADAAPPAVARLTGLSLTGYKKLDDAALQDFLFGAAPRGCGLRHLDVSGCWRLSDETLRALLTTHAATLQSLDVSACFALTAAGLCAALSAAALPQLASFTMGYSEEVTPEVLSALFATAPQLQTLRLPACVSLSDDAGVCVARHGHALRELDISGGSSVTDGFFASFGSFPPPSATLSPAQIYRLSVGPIDDAPGSGSDSEADAADAAEAPPRYPLRRLQTVHLDHCARLTTAGVARLLRSCPSVTELHVRFCANVVARDIAALLERDFQRQLRRFTRRRQRQLLEQLRSSDALDADVDAEADGATATAAAAAAAATRLEAAAAQSSSPLDAAATTIVAPRLRSLSVSV